MMKRILSFVLGAALVIVLAVPVQAAETDGAWVELLETATVNDSGNNLFTLAATSGTFRIKTPQYMRLTKVDMLISHPSGATPTAVSVWYNGSYYGLTVAKIDAYTTRVYGANIPDTLYADVYFQFTKSGTASVTYQILSCRVTSLYSQEYQADADVYIRETDTTYGVNYNSVVPAADESGVTDGQVRVTVYDWRKYDSLTIWGSAVDFPISSIRATLGTLGLPITVSYMEGTEAGGYITWDSIETGAVDDYGIYQHDGTGWADLETRPAGKWLYCITIDLSGADRTLGYPIYIYFTGIYEMIWGYTFNCQYVNGSISVADTTQVTWWNRFTKFMDGLFGVDDSAADEFESQMESQGQEMQDAVDQLDTMQKPAVSDINVDLSGIVSNSDLTLAASPLSALLSNELFFSMTLISLTLALVAYVLYGKR